MELPGRGYTYHSDLVEFDTSGEAYLFKRGQFSARPIDAASDMARPVSRIDGCATGAVVFCQHDHASSEPRVLLVQRALHDSMPGLWEVPGGAVDPGEVILDGVAREAKEETGLEVMRVTWLIPHTKLEHGEQQGLPRAANKYQGDEFNEGYLFSTRSGKVICKFTFVVEVRQTQQVTLDPAEHRDYVWATEDECRTRKAGSATTGAAVDLAFTRTAQEEAVLKAFAANRGR